MEEQEKYPQITQISLIRRAKKSPQITRITRIRAEQKGMVGLLDD